MTLRTAARRLAVTLGLAVAILAAAGTILAASRWTATEAPLAQAPVSVESVQAALSQERDRSAALEAQLRVLEGASGDLSGALTAARQQLAADDATAAELRTALAKAQAKLAKLEASLKAASRTTVTTVRTTTRATSGGGEREDEHEDEHEGGDDD
jgi:septal ring factor EnvC (AmiA/AmiB activator)